MKSMTAEDAKTNFGQFLDAANREPVSIMRNGRQVAVVLSLEDYELLSAVEDAWWARQAERNEAEGLLSAEESEAFHQSLRNARD